MESEHEATKLMKIGKVQKILPKNEVQQRKETNEITRESRFPYFP